MKFFYFAMVLFISIFLVSCGSPDNDCSKDNLDGDCEGTKVCQAGECKEKSELCSAKYPEGYCEGDFTCKEGVCIDNNICSDEKPTGNCEDTNKFCDKGVCKDKLISYKLGTIIQVIEEINNRPKVTDEYHVEIMDINGRNKRRITNDVQSCINEDSCWLSNNYTSLLYLKEVTEGVYSLNIVDIPEDFNVDFTKSEMVTKKLRGKITFLNDGKHFIYIEDVSPSAEQDLIIKKYDMVNKTSIELAKFSISVNALDDSGNPVIDDNGNPVMVNASAGKYIVSKDNSTLVFNFDNPKAYNPPVEIYSLNLNDLNQPPKLFYRYKRANLSGSGLEWASLSSDNKKLVFITDFDLEHRLHIAHLDSSDFIESGLLVEAENPKDNIPLGKFIGPTENACANIQGVQFCEMKSNLNFSKDNKFVYFAGRVDGGTELSRLSNIYRFDVANDTLEKVTNESIEGHNFKNPGDPGYVRNSFQDLPIKTIIFNMDTENAIYTIAEPGSIVNHDAHYINLNSKAKEMDLKTIAKTRNAREVKLFMLKK